MILYMARTLVNIFYSWQSDLPNATNRGFIHKALTRAANTVTGDSSIGVEPVIDRDTEGVAGAPDIAETIFEKILAAEAFVADVSIVVGRRTKRPMPNPNVLIELGYALHGLGDDRVILVFNEAYGRLEQLPFDLKMRRTIPYRMSETAGERATERTALEAKLSHAIRLALNGRRRTELVSMLTYRAIAAHLCDAMAQVFVEHSLDDCRPMTAILEGRDNPDSRTLEGLAALSTMLRGVPNPDDNELSDTTAQYYQNNMWDLDQICDDLLLRLIQLGHPHEQDLIDALMTLDLVRRALQTSIIAHRQVVTGGVFVHLAELVDASAGVYKALARHWKAAA